MKKFEESESTTKAFEEENESKIQVKVLGLMHKIGVFDTSLITRLAKILVW